MDRDRSVGIATLYGQDGPGIESLWRRDLPHLSRPALGACYIIQSVEVLESVGIDR